MRLPKAFIQTIEQVYGQSGEQWLANLDCTINQIETNHHIRILDPLPNLAYNLICNAIDANGNAAIFRFGPRHKEIHLELQAIKAFQGDGMVRLLNVFPEGGMLLEKLSPGTTLEEIASQEEDDRATLVLAETVKKLSGANTYDQVFPTVQDWANGFSKLRKMFGGGTGPLDPNDVERAEKIFEEFVATPEVSPRLLHGDLHHGNVLSDANRGWVAIDPKGVIGERAYECACMFYNPRSFIDQTESLRPVLDRRIEILSENLGCDARRIRGYAFAQCILSAWWTIEDHEELDRRALRVAEALY